MTSSSNRATAMPACGRRGRPGSPRPRSPEPLGAAPAAARADLAGVLGDVVRHGCDLSAAQAALEGGHAAAAVSDLLLDRGRVGLQLVEVRPDRAAGASRAEPVAAPAVRDEDLLAVDPARDGCRRRA